MNLSFQQNFTPQTQDSNYSSSPTSPEITFPKYTCFPPMRGSFYNNNTSHDQSSNYTYIYCINLHDHYLSITIYSDHYTKDDVMLQAKELLALSKLRELTRGIVKFLLPNPVQPINYLHRYQSNYQKSDFKNLMEDQKMISLVRFLCK